MFLCRQDRSDDSKALVPGERVSIHISDALGMIIGSFLIVFRWVF